MAVDQAIITKLYPFKARRQEDQGWFYFISRVPSWQGLVLLKAYQLLTEYEYLKICSTYTPKFLSKLGRQEASRLVRIVSSIPFTLPRAVVPVQLY